jgi:hypothetical protein
MGLGVRVGVAVGAGVGVGVKVGVHVGGAVGLGDDTAMPTGATVTVASAPFGAAVRSQRLATATNARMTIKASPSDRWPRERRAPSVLFLRSVQGREWRVLYHKRRGLSAVNAEIQS